MKTDFTDLATGCGVAAVIMALFLGAGSCHIMVRFADTLKPPAASNTTTNQ